MGRDSDITGKQPIGCLQLEKDLFLLPSHGECRASVGNGLFVFWKWMRPWSTRKSQILGFLGSSTGFFVFVFVHGPNVGPPGGHCL